MSYFRIISANLIRHEMAHTQEFPRPYKCPKCEACFETKLVLEHHEWTHIPLEERPKTFPCPRCTRAFETQKRLQAHIREHKQSESRDAKCAFCEKAYHRKNALKDHLTSFHKLTEQEAKASAGIASKILIIRQGEEISKPETRPMKPTTACDLCSRKYSRREYLTTHYMALHGKTEAEAKKLTGLESRRSLTVPSTTRGVGRKGRRLVDPLEVDESSEELETVEIVIDPTPVNEFGKSEVPVQYPQETYWITPPPLPPAFYTTL